MLHTNQTNKPAAGSIDSESIDSESIDSLVKQGIVIAQFTSKKIEYDSESNRTSKLLTSDLYVQVIKLQTTEKELFKVERLLKEKLTPKKFNSTLRGRFNKIKNVYLHLLKEKTISSKTFTVSSLCESLKEKNFSIAKADSVLASKKREIKKALVEQSEQRERLFELGLSTPEGKKEILKNNLYKDIDSELLINIVDPVTMQKVIEKGLKEDSKQEKILIKEQEKQDLLKALDLICNSSLEIDQIERLEKLSNKFRKTWKNEKIKKIA